MRGNCFSLFDICRKSRSQAPFLLSKATQNALNRLSLSHCPSPLPVFRVSSALSTPTSGLEKEEETVVNGFKTPETPLMSSDAQEPCGIPQKETASPSTTTPTHTDTSHITARALQSAASPAPSHLSVFLDLGHCRTGTLPQCDPRVLPRCSG